MVDNLNKSQILINLLQIKTYFVASLVSTRTKREITFLSGAVPSSSGDKKLFSF